MDWVERKVIEGGLYIEAVKVSLGELKKHDLGSETPKMLSMWHKFGFSDICIAVSLSTDIFGVM